MKSKKVKAGKGSKRKTGVQKHKVIRKKRENLRDMRKAAKSMRRLGNNGQKLRTNKSRLAAKMALKTSNANPDKMKILTQLLKTRASFKEERAQRRKLAREAMQTEDEGVGEGEFDGDDGIEAKGDDADLPKLTSKEVQELHRKMKKDAAKTMKQDARKRMLRLLIPTGADVGNPVKQFSVMLSRMRHAVPVVMCVLDARCAVQSCPWDMIDEAVADALLASNGMRTALPKDMPARSTEKSKALIAEGGGSSLISQLPDHAMATRHVVFLLNKCDLLPLDTLCSQLHALGEALYARYRKHVNPCGGVRSVTFQAWPFSYTLDVTVQYTMRGLRDILHARKAYLTNTSSTVDEQVQDSFERHNLLGRLGVGLIGAPGVGKTTVARALRGAYGGGSAIAVRGSGAVAIVPCRSVRVQEDIVEEPVADPQQSEVQVATLKSKKRSRGASSVEMVKPKLEASKVTRRLVFPDAKPITLVTVADDELAKRATVCGMDAVFHSLSSIERHKTPEVPAVLAVEQFLDNASLCQLFSLPLFDSAVGLLKGLGRCVIREGGFVSAQSAIGVAGSMSESALTISNLSGGRTLLGGRLVRQRGRFADRRHALRTGARVFLKELHIGANLVWATSGNTEDVMSAAAVGLAEEQAEAKKMISNSSKNKRKAAGRKNEMSNGIKTAASGDKDEDEKDTDEAAARAFLRLFTVPHIPKALLPLVNAHKATANKDAIHCVLPLLVCQELMKEQVPLLPQSCLLVRPDGVTLPTDEEKPRHDDNEGSSDDDVEESEEFEEEEEEERPDFDTFNVFGESVENSEEEGEEEGDAEEWEEEELEEYEESDGEIVDFEDDDQPAL